MTRVVFDGPEALVAAVGSRLGPTDSLKITQETVSQFASLTRDEQWIHVDPERAAASSFGGTIAHGFYTLSLCSWALDQLQTTTGFSSGINYGLDRVRFPAPLLVGDSLTGWVELVEATQVKGGIQGKWLIELWGANPDRPACSAVMISRYLV